MGELAPPRTYPAGKERPSRTSPQRPHQRRRSAVLVRRRADKPRLGSWTGLASAPKLAGGQGAPLQDLPSGPTPGAAVVLESCSTAELGLCACFVHTEHPKYTLCKLLSCGTLCAHLSTPTGYRYGGANKHLL